MSATSPNDLKQHLSSPGTVIDLLESDKIKEKPAGKRNMNISAGISNNGFNFELMRKNILKTGDFTKFAFNQNQERMRTYSFTFMQPYLLLTSRLPSALFNEDIQDETSINAAYTYEIDTKSSKFESRENSHIFELSS